MDRINDYFTDNPVIQFLLSVAISIICSIKFKNIYLTIIIFLCLVIIILLFNLIKTPKIHVQSLNKDSNLVNIPKRRYITQDSILELYYVNGSKEKKSIALIYIYAIVDKKCDGYIIRKSPSYKKEVHDNINNLYITPYILLGDLKLGKV